MTAEVTPRTILGIPGRWLSQQDLVRSVIQHTDGYIFAGQILMHTDSQTHFMLEVHEPDEKLAQAFHVASGGRIPTEELKQIETHTQCLYLVGDGGSIERATQFLHAADALLAAGGLAVKVESAGKAFSAADWHELNADAGLGALLQAFVTYVGSEGNFYSCGMHNLGHPDCVIDAPVEPRDAAELMHMFAGYLLMENPELHAAETFSIAPDTPAYRLLKDPCTRFDPDEPFYNPYGVWRLVPA